MTAEARTGEGGGLDCLDMSVVSDITVARALRALLADWRMRRRWEAFPRAARRLHRDILRSYLDTGAPPDPAGLDKDLLGDLVARDLVVPGARGIAAAYPFSTGQTRHRVTIGGRSLFAVCAIDALGAGAMAGRAARVASRCPVCEAEIRVDIEGGGLGVAAVSPGAACVWAGIVAVEGCAAETQCQAMLLFCSPNHLGAWRARQAQVPEGFALGVGQAVQAGAAIFRPFLRRDNGRATG
ncbi:MAG: organomercurial lyase [Paracoccaceae bacterium]